MSQVRALHFNYNLMALRKIIVNQVLPRKAIYSIVINTINVNKLVIVHKIPFGGGIFNYLINMDFGTSEDQKV